MSYNQAKQCALICCDEMIEEVREYCDHNHHQQRMMFLGNVKQEILNY